MKFLTTIIFLFLCVSTYAQTSKRVDRLLDAIEKVESGGRSRAIGDHGRSKGPYQIQYRYYQDGAQRAKIRTPYYVGVWDRNTSRAVVKGYWSRYANTALKYGKLETLARVHNGGPRGHRKAATVGYWNKVRREMR